MKVCSSAMSTDPNRPCFVVVVCVWFFFGLCVLGSVFNVVFSRNQQPELHFGYGLKS